MADDVPAGIGQRSPLLGTVSAEIEAEKPTRFIVGIVPGVASSVLDDDVSRRHRGRNAIVEFEVALSGNHIDKVERVGPVHTATVALKGCGKARQ